MNKALLNDVETKKFLAIITDQKGKVIWESAKSPASTLYKDYYRGKFLDREKMSVYANQAGMAIAVIADQIGIENCYAIQMSRCGLKMFQKKGIHVEYQELIPLVKSSKDPTQICPIEKFLSEHSDDEDAQWNFLEERFNNNKEAPSCSIKDHKKKKV